MQKDQPVHPIADNCARIGAAVHGYEIHAGLTQGEDCSRPMLKLDTGLDGAVSSSGLVEGSYVHGLWSSDRFKRNCWNETEPGQVRILITEPTLNPHWKGSQTAWEPRWMWRRYWLAHEKIQDYKFVK